MPSHFGHFLFALASSRLLAFGHVDQQFTGRLAGVIESLQLEIIEPDAAAAGQADIDDDAPALTGVRFFTQTGQFIFRISFPAGILWPRNQCDGFYATTWLLANRTLAGLGWAGAFARCR